MCGGSGVWNSLRDTQRGRAELRQIRPKAIRKSSGELCMGPESTPYRWHGHFETVLNIRSNFEECDPVCRAAPSEGRVSTAAVEELKGNKAGGITGILLEMLK